MTTKHTKLVIKVGTNVITDNDGLLDEIVLENIIDQIAMLKKQGIDVILISSGAVGAGSSLLEDQNFKNPIVRRQKLAAIGQVKLMNMYEKLLQKHNLLCGQILITKDNFRTRKHYLNIKNCVEALMSDNIVPIVNENDVVSVDELMFTDNDELARFIVCMLGVERCVLMTNVDGVFDRHPREKDAVLLHTIDDSTDYKSIISSEKSDFGRGGMLTKCHVANQLSQLGTTTHIVNGKQKNIIVDILNGKEYGTTFQGKSLTSNIKRWITCTEGQEKGAVIVNDGAATALLNNKKACSLLPIGITKIIGTFKKGDIIHIKNKKKENIGIGIANYSWQTAKTYLNQKDKKCIVHYNNLFII